MVMRAPQGLIRDGVETVPTNREMRLPHCDSFHLHDPLELAGVCILITYFGGFGAQLRWFGASIRALTRAARENGLQGRAQPASLRAGRLQIRAYNRQFLPGRFHFRERTTVLRRPAARSPVRPPDGTGGIRLAPSRADQTSPSRWRRKSCPAPQWDRRMDRS